MSERVPPLHPWPLARLLNRIQREWEGRSEIFGLAGRRFFRADPAVDLGCSLGGRQVGTPVGPAAGPHTQLAQNMVLAWLAGSRSFELKTVQVLDELDIERPCIDMENVGYNIEWSQELTLDQSRREYVKTALLLEILRRWEPLGEVIGDPGDHLFEVSVGYDLAGIQSEKMTRFLEGLLAAGPVIDELRGEIPPAFAHLRDVPVPGRLAHTATLSTFHGCPPDEIEGIVKHLMEVHQLDVTVKLNHTLLGMDRVAAIVHDRLGYRDVTLVPEAFAEDLQWNRALEMVDRLENFARGCGRTLGLKLTNTLVVDNGRGVMPGQRMYLSGKPLHVLAITLLEQLDRALPGRLDLGSDGGAIPVAFSAGIDKDNLAAAVGLGLRPVTVCSDLLRPGGYGRLAQGLRKLVKEMRTTGCADLAAWVARSQELARENGCRNAAEALALSYAQEPGYHRYTLAATDRPLRQVDHQLEMFDCVACGNCVTVCPNNAFLALPSPQGKDLQARSQYLVLAELCNECGNCTTFCPETGAPHLIKPALFTDRKLWQARGGQGFLLTKDGEGDLCLGGPQEGRELTLEILESGPGLPLDPADLPE
jgi:putative selenate reductase